MIKFETDSRLVKPGQVFVAIKGNTVDGHDYIKEAFNNGAVEVIAEHPVDVKGNIKIVDNSVAYLREELRKEYADKINNSLKIIGVTGTNGKTTTCYLTYQLLKKLGVNVGYLGTIGFSYNDKVIETNNTTPDTWFLYDLFLQAIADGIDTIVMEVSSHSLDFDRLYGLHIDVAAFTNLTEDHLDYHKTMENYLNAKLKIFDYMSNVAWMIVNKDDSYSNEFIKKAKNCITLGYDGDIKLLDYKMSPANTNIKFEYDMVTYDTTINLVSIFNVYNFLTALAIVFKCGYSIQDILKYSLDVLPPRGRCETLKINGGFAVIDYAHTPDAVLKVITAYNNLKTRKLTTIIGCGGDRDPIKRPLMGEIATRLSDYVILTSDNPRTEDPEKIMDDILKGVKTDNYEVILDRKEAIKKAITNIKEDDIVLV